MTEFLHRVVRRFWADHPCVIVVSDFALGESFGFGRSVTAFEYECQLCGRKFVELTQPGIEALQRGLPMARVTAMWMEKGRG